MCALDQFLYVAKNLLTATHVFVKHDQPPRLFQPHYHGPYPGLRRNNNTTVLQTNYRKATIVIELLNQAQKEDITTGAVFNRFPQIILFRHPSTPTLRFPNAGAPLSLTLLQIIFRPHLLLVAKSCSAAAPTRMS